MDRGGFWITAGIPDSPLNGYYRARNVLIAFNTVVDSRGPYIDLDAGFGSSRRTLRPGAITITNRPLTAADVEPSWMDRRPPKDGGR